MIIVSYYDSFLWLMICNRLDSEGAGAVDGWETVLLQRAGAPAVDAAHAAVLAVKRENGESRFLEL